MRPGLATVEGKKVLPRASLDHRGVLCFWVLGMGFSCKPNYTMLSGIVIQWPSIKKTKKKKEEKKTKKFVLVFFPDFFSFWIVEIGWDSSQIMA